VGTLIDGIEKAVSMGAVGALIDNIKKEAV